MFKHVWFLRRYLRWKITSDYVSDCIGDVCLGDIIAHVIMCTFHVYWR